MKINVGRQSNVRHRPFVYIKLRWWPPIWMLHGGLITTSSLHDIINIFVYLHDIIDIYPQATDRKLCTWYPINVANTPSILPIPESCLYGTEIPTKLWARRSAMVYVEIDHGLPVVRCRDTLSREALDDPRTPPGSQLLPRPRTRGRTRPALYHGVGTVWA